MKTSIIKIVVIIISVLIALFLVYQVLLIQENKDYQKRAALLIEKIETFKRLEKRLPNDVKELGLEEPMNDGPYYEKKDNVIYVVFFNVGFDHDTYIYYSDKKKWKWEP